MGCLAYNGIRSIYLNTIKWHKLRIWLVCILSPVLEGWYKYKYYIIYIHCIRTTQVDSSTAETLKRWPSDLGEGRISGGGRMSDAEGGEGEDIKGNKECENIK